MTEYKANKNGYAIERIYDVGDIVTIYTPDDVVKTEDYYIKSFGNEEVILETLIFREIKKMTYENLRKAMRKVFIHTNMGYIAEDDAPDPQEIKFVFKGEKRLRFEFEE